MAKPKLKLVSGESKNPCSWQDYIHSDPNVLLGKPVVKGTRLSIDFIMRLFDNGWTVTQVLESYPQLTLISLQAVFAFAAESLSQETVYAMPMEHA